MELRERKPLRLNGYDYSGAGYYFVTVCTQARAEIFWDGERAGLEPAPTDMAHLRAGLEPAPTNEFGKLVAQTWLELPAHTSGIRVDQFVVMPNHFHGIVILENGCGCVGAGSKPARTPLAEAMRQFKTFSAKKINKLRGTPGRSVWQRGYYDHIIRNEADYLRIWQYIDANPARWTEDEYCAPKER